MHYFFRFLFFFHFFLFYDVYHNILVFGVVLFFHFTFAFIIYDSNFAHIMVPKLKQKPSHQMLHNLWCDETKSRTIFRVSDVVLELFESNVFTQKPRNKYCIIIFFFYFIIFSFYFLPQEHFI